MRDFTPSTDTSPVEVLERFEYGFISYREYQLYWLRRLDSDRYRGLVARICGLDTAMGLPSDDTLARLYHDFMVRRTRARDQGPVV